MHVIRVFIWIWLICETALWVRGSASFSLFDTLPFAVRLHALDADYELMALAVTVVGVWGLLKVLKRQPQPRPQTAAQGPSRAWLVLPGLLILLAVLRNQVHLQISLDRWGVSLEQRYLAVLGLTIVGLIVSIREFRRLP